MPTVEFLSDTGSAKMLDLCSIGGRAGLIRRLIGYSGAGT
jgi:hypothetical protein